MSTAQASLQLRTARSRFYAAWAVPILLLSSCAALSPGQADRDRTYRDIEEGRMTASQASERDRRPPVDVTELILGALTMVTAGGGLSYGIARRVSNNMSAERDRRRKERGEQV